MVAGLINCRKNEYGKRKVMTIGNVMFLTGLALIIISLVIVIVSLVTAGKRRSRMEEYLNNNYGQGN